MPAPARWCAEQLAEGGELHEAQDPASELLAHACSAFDCPPMISGNLRDKHALMALRRPGTCR
jgi:hypothetical protein